MSEQVEAKSAKIEEMEEEMEEAIHFTRVIKSFQGYRKDALSQVAACEKQFNNLLESHQKYLPNHVNVLDQKRACIEHNNVICQLIVRRCENAFQNKEFKETHKDTTKTKPRPMDLDKVRTTLKQIVRDWSSEGELERATCYQLMVDEILTRLPISQNGRKSSVLVPGCGLGRLAWEIARLGYRCEGNEFSFFMLFTSDFILNRTPQSSKQDFHQFQIYPWVTGKCNVKSWKSTLKPVKFPDVNPADLPENSEFSMAAGDFLECYESARAWNCVATCYFIDTAHNIIAYIERIFDILTPGGLWVNFGPLLYHFSDMPNESSVEFSYEEVIEIIKNVGFRIIKEEPDLPSTYLNLSGKVAIITGASSGIGRATSLLFSKLGCDLSLVGRNEKSLKATQEECEKNRVKVIAVPADVSCINDIDRVVKESQRNFQKLDILVNNAGILKGGTIENTVTEDFQSVMEVNLMSAFHLMQAFLPQLIETKGSIVNVSSVNGIRSFPGALAYNVSKAALDQLTRCSALELSSKGVRVNCVNPGVVVTELHKRSGMNDEAYKAFLERCKTTHALGRPGNADEVAWAIAYLASDASSFVTGHSLPVDGGRHAMCPR